MGVRLAAEEGFQPPSTADFELPPVFADNPFTTKPVFLVFFSVILISTFFILASRKASVVPSKLQFAGESIYGFVRNDLARDVIGPENSDCFWHLEVFLQALQGPNMSHIIAD